MGNVSAKTMKDSRKQLLALNKSAVKTTPTEEEGRGDVRKRRESNSGMHRPSSLSLPSSIRKPPAVLSGNQISDLSSACCAGTSRPHYPPHYPPLLFPYINAISPMPLSLPSSVPLTLFLSFSSLSVPMSSPVDHQRANDVINCSLVSVIDSWHCGGGGGT